MYISGGDMTEFPCKKCVTLAICLAQYKGKYSALSLLRIKCKLFREYCLTVGSGEYLRPHSDFRNLFWDGL
jgi:hypothetical protein